MNTKFGTAKEMLGLEVTDFTENGKCSGCGACCSNLLPMTSSEVKRIKQYVKKHNIKDQAISVLNTNVVNWVCPFRNELHKKCEIYEVRPAICRDYQCDKQVRGEITFGAMKFSENYMPTMVRETIYG